MCRGMQASVEGRDGCGGAGGGIHLVVREEEELLAARKQLKRVLCRGLRLGSAQLNAHLRGGCGGVGRGLGGAEVRMCGGAEVRRCGGAEARRCGGAEVLAYSAAPRSSSRSDGSARLASFSMSWRTELGRLSTPKPKCRESTSCESSTCTGRARTGCACTGCAGPEETC